MFSDDGSGFLAVNFKIFPRGSNVPILDQTIDSNPYDPMSTVGGNRYGWFYNEEIPDLAIDNSLRTGLCHQGDEEGDMQGRDSGQAHSHFHAKSCEGGQSEGDVEHSDPGSGTDFKSTSIDSVTFTAAEDSQTLTMVGTGLDNGLPVGFTLVAVDNGSLGPGAYSLALTDGYALTGNLISGGLTIQ